MGKVRVYELSKQLNTTSKRLMEKLKEINIIVKNHMSLLKDEELNALYDHIGVIKHESGESEQTAKTRVNKADPSKVIDKKTVDKKIIDKKEVKGTPRIIRKTEIFIDDNKNTNEKVKNKKNNNWKNKDRKKSIVRRTDENSGLRMGFARDTGRETIRTIKNEKEILKDTNKMNFVENKVEDKTKNIESVAKSNEDEKNLRKDNTINKKATQTVNETESIKKSFDENNSKTTFDKSNTMKSEDNRNKFRDNKDKRPYSNNTQNRSNTQNRPNTQNRSNDQNRTNNQNRPNAQNRSNTQNRPNTQNRSNNQNRYNTQNKDFGNRDNRTTRDSNDNRDNRQRSFNNRSTQTSGASNSNRQNTRYGSNQGNKQRNFNKTQNKPLEIPKADLTVVKKDENNHIKVEQRREFQNKEAVKDYRKDGRKDNTKREIGKGNLNKNSKYKPKTQNIVGEKKGVSEVLSEEFVLNEFYSDDGFKKSKRLGRNKKDFNKKDFNKKEIPKPKVVVITVPEILTVKELAEKLKKTATEVIKKLMGLGVMATVNQDIDFDTATVISEEFGISVKKEIIVNEEDILFDDSDDDEKDLETRPPVVVVMGHVDHGKTSLLDSIRETNIIEKEAGGITQHIGAYRVSINNRIITFLDTPGHEAFTAMRARGAQVTDIAILVVAADDGIMPQTIEAIDHAKAANISVIVAINKIDKEGANPDKVKQDLTSHGLVPEDWGGDIICVPVSAKQKLNIDQLLEMVLLSADVLELKTNKSKQAKGTVIEAKMDKNRGAVATILVQRGTLKVGDSIVTGSLVGRIRAMSDDRGKKVLKAGPSTPVEILGLPEVPDAGELFYAVKDEKIARQLVEKRRVKTREETLRSSSKVSLDDLFQKIKDGEVKDLNIIIKADVQGSVEAVKQSLEKLTNEEVRIKVIHGGVGTITDSNITLAEVSNAIIIGFNVRPSTVIAEKAKSIGVDIRLYRVIYKAIEDIEAAMKGLLDPTFAEVVQGHTEIRQLFKVSGLGTIGGCYVQDGKILRNSDVRILRDGIIVHEGKLSSLKRFKDDAKEVLQGYECGLQIDRFNDIKEGDVVESFTMEQVEK
ncbi:MAG: translation initiation factor IF-2 [Clostridiales bacterium]